MRGIFVNLRKQSAFNMEIAVKDDQGLRTGLMMDGFSDNQICDAYAAVRKQFKEAATLVFSTTLGRELPKQLIVNTSQTEDKKDNFTTLAYFHSDRSSEGHYVFTMLAVTVRNYITGQSGRPFRDTVIHEMTHAADLPMLLARNKMLEELNQRIRIYRANPYVQPDAYNDIALLNLLHMLGHYRAEGVALLGEHLLTRKAFRMYGSLSSAFKRFRNAFVYCLQHTEQLSLGTNEGEDPNKNAIFNWAYLSAPVILLMVLERLRLVEMVFCRKALSGLQTGTYNLTDADIQKILKAAMSLSLESYIQGVMMLGESVAPIRPMLELCAKLQEDRIESNIEDFSVLMRSPENYKDYKAALKSIMGSTLNDEELDACYRRFLENPPDDQLYPDLKEKVVKLYSFIPDDADPDAQNIARWALTYFFDDEDLIHDDLTGLGWVDDRMVIDYAMRVIEDRNVIKRLCES